MFGIFTQGGRHCTKQDFTYTVLHRLKLGADGLTESDLDLIYRNNEYLSIADVIMK